MRIALRVVAAWLMLNAIAYVPGTWRIGQAAVFLPTLTAKYAIALGALLLLAAVASVELWRLRERGRRAAIAYSGLGGIALLMIYAGEGTLEHPRSLFKLLLHLVAIIVLVSPSAKRICRARDEGSSQPDNNELQRTKPAQATELRR